MSYRSAWSVCVLVVTSGGRPGDIDEDDEDLPLTIHDCKLVRVLLFRNACSKSHQKKTVTTLLLPLLISGQLLLVKQLTIIVTVNQIFHNRFFISPCGGFYMA